MMPFMGIGSDQQADSCVGVVTSDNRTAFCGDVGTRNRICAIG